jgi:hypothetical protein
MSILRGRELRKCRYGIPETQWWSAKPKEYELAINRSPLGQVAFQVAALSRDIYEFSKSVTSDRWCELTYEEFCEIPGECLSEIAAFSGVGITCEPELEIRPVSNSSLACSERNERIMGALKRAEAEIGFELPNLGRY